MIQALDDEHGPQGHGRGGAVTVRLEAAELEAADRLITAGVAASRAEALRWAAWMSHRRRWNSMKTASTPYVLVRVVPE